MRTGDGTVRRAILAIGVGLLGAAWPVSSALAQPGAEDTDADDQIVLTGIVRVLEGETVATVVIFNGPARVDGIVEQTLVVFNGEVDISGTVREDVVVFNGRAVVRSGAVIGGDLVTREPPEVESGATIRGNRESIAGRFDFENLGFAEKIAWWIGYSVSTLILGLLLLWFAPRLDDAIGQAVRRRTGVTIGVGVGVFLLVPIFAVILLVTIVGIPLGIFTLLALALLYTVGYVAGAIAFGRLLVRPPRSRIVAFLAGWVILRLLGLIPVVGGLVWLAATIVGLGALFVGARRKPVEERAAPTPGMGQVPAPP